MQNKIFEHCVCVRTVQDDTVRVYARVYVTIDNAGIFTVVTGVEADDKDKDKDMDGEINRGKTVQLARSITGVMVNQIDNHDNIIRDNVQVNADISMDVQRNTLGEHSSGNQKNVLRSSIVAEWSISQQDYSELFFLANNANYSGSVRDENGVNKHDVDNSDNKNNSSSSSSSSSVINLRSDNSKNNIDEKDHVSHEQNEMKIEIKKNDLTAGREGKKSEGLKKEKDSSRKSQIVPLILEMKEPDPETPQGMDLWLLWFEGLKTSENIISSYLL